MEIIWDNIETLRNLFSPGNWGIFYAYSTLTILLYNINYISKVIEAFKIIIIIISRCHDNELRYIANCNSHNISSNTTNDY